MGDIRQEGPILKLNKRQIKVTKQGLWHKSQEIYGLLGL